MAEHAIGAALDDRLIGPHGDRALEIAAEHAEAVSPEQARGDHDQEPGEEHRDAMIAHAELGKEHRHEDSHEHHDALSHDEGPIRWIPRVGVDAPLGETRVTKHAELPPERPGKYCPERDS